MTRNMLKLNDDKTKLSFSNLSIANVQVGGRLVEVSSKIRNLWITFNQTLLIQTHVNDFNAGHVGTNVLYFRTTVLYFRTTVLYFSWLPTELVF